MVHLFEMAEFVDDEFVGFAFREEENFIVESEVATRRADTPAGFKLFHPYLSVQKFIFSCSSKRPCLHTNEAHGLCI